MAKGTKTIRVAVTAEKKIYIVRHVNTNTHEVLCWGEVVSATRHRRGHAEGIKRFKVGEVALVELPNNDKVHDMLLEQGVAALRDAGVTVTQTRKGNYRY